MLKALYKRLRDSYHPARGDTNDSFTRKDAEFPIRHSALTEELIIGV